VTGTQFEYSYEANQIFLQQIQLGSLSLRHAGSRCWFGTILLFSTIALVLRRHFVYAQNMVASGSTDDGVHAIAAAIGDPGRSKMLFCLMDDRARTATELAIVANVGAPTASFHLTRLTKERLVKVVKQGKHRYYTLGGTHVASALESLLVLSENSKRSYGPTTPSRLRSARTCYDHIAGELGVALHDRMIELGWIAHNKDLDEKGYQVSSLGIQKFNSLGIDVPQLDKLRRQLAVPCLDWSERRPHLAGALGAEILSTALKKKWVVRDLESRALAVTTEGRREFFKVFGLNVA
jgi:DNA-binding transcriptional ArsR family regulator